jgi:hypothetical protein
MMNQRHFVDVWNPSYASNAMEAHLAVLLDAVRKFDAGELAADEEIFVWWGKVRSANRQQPLRHLAAAVEIGAELEADEEREGHLYLTDYRSLYVAHVGGVCRGDAGPPSSAYVPDYYARSRLDCDFWYKLMDIRRLVADDTIAVIAELKQLRNPEYHDRPVSLYGGMVDLPLIVARPDGKRFFAPEVRDPVTDERLWAEFDAEAGGIGAMEKELRENLFGDAAWMSLEPAARTFIATAEKIFRDHRSDAGFDFAPVVGGLAKALEVTCNEILRSVASSLPSETRRVRIQDQDVEVGGRRPLTLGQFARVVGGERAINHALAHHLEYGGWFVGSLPPIIEDLLKTRNPGVHEERIDRETATRVRNNLVGVGCQGTFQDLARVWAR